MAWTVAALGLQLLVFSLYFLSLRLHQHQISQLRAWLVKQNNQELEPVLLDVGIWSKELLATTPMRVLPAQLLSDKRFVTAYRALKDQANNEVMLPLWLRDNQLQHFTALSENQLHLLGYKSPGDIFQYIYSDTNLEQAQRHILRSDVHRFKQAVKEFMSAYQNNIAIIAHKERYEKEVSSWAWHLGPEAAASYLQQYPWDVAATVVFALLCCYITHQAIPDTLPGHSSFLPALALVWAMPQAGQVTIYIILLARMWVDPLKTTIYAVVLTVWLQATTDFPDLKSQALFSMLPTVLYYVAVHILSFQPLVTYCEDAVQNKKQKTANDRPNGTVNKGRKKGDLESKDNNNKKARLETDVHPEKTKHKGKDNTSDTRTDKEDQGEGSPGKPLDVVITGIGCMDKYLLRFIRKQSLPWIYRKLLSLHIEQGFTWDHIDRIKVDEVDLNWHSLWPLIQPSLQSNHLQTLWIINNRAFGDAEAGELADQLHKNTSLKHLKVAFDYEYSLLEHVYHLLLWDATGERFTSQGAQALLDAVRDNKHSHIQILDFYGVKLEPSFIESARELKAQRPHLTIMGCKPEQVTRSLSSHLSTTRLVQGLCMLAVAAICCYGIWNSVTDLREQVIWSAWPTDMDTLFHNFKNEFL